MNNLYEILLEELEKLTTTEVSTIIEQLSTKLVIPTNQIMESISKIGVKNFVEAMIIFIIVISSIWLYFISDKIEKINRVEEKNKLETLGAVMTLPIFIGLTIIFIYISSIILWSYSPKVWSIDYMFNIIYLILLNRSYYDECE
jgi:hypothetical protein